MEGWSALECLGSACLTYEEHCEDLACSRVIKHCEPTSPQQEVSSSGFIEDCSLVKREGALPDTANVGGLFDQDLMIVFATEDVEGEGMELKAGYNAIQGANPDKHAWAKNLSCELDARARVSNNPGDDSEEELEARIEEAETRCPQVPKYERLANPSARELTISLGEAWRLQ